MRKILFIVILLISFKTVAQNDPKIAFQKSKYKLALSYYKKEDFKKAIDLFGIAAKIKLENEIGKESIKKVDTLKLILRKNILENALGTWKMSGDKPIWASATTKKEQEKDFDELIEISQKEILFYEKNIKTQIKKLTRTENLVYYNKDRYDSLYSEIILSDGTIWECMINEKLNVLHVINVAKKNEDDVEQIKSDNLERFYEKVN